jgi:hypothetical protein
MEAFLVREHKPAATLQQAFTTASDAWLVGSMALGESGVRELPDAQAIAAYRREGAADHQVEAALLERGSRSAIRYRTLAEHETRSLSAS